MTTRFYMIRDINGYNGFGLPFCDDKFNVTLAVGVAQTGRDLFCKPIIFLGRQEPSF